MTMESALLSNISLPNTEIVADKPITINLSAKPYPIVNGDLRIKTLATRDFQHLDARLQNVNLRFNGLVKAQMNDAHAEIAVNLKEKQQKPLKHVILTDI